MPFPEKDSGDPKTYSPADVHAYRQTGISLSVIVSASDFC